MSTPVATFSDGDSGLTILTLLNDLITRWNNLGANGIGIKWASKARKTITGVTAETTLLDVGNGSLTFPINSLRVGEIFRVKLNGLYSSIGNNVTFKVKMGSTVLVNQTISTLSTLTDKAWRMEFDLYVISLGVSGDVGCIGSMIYSNGDNLPPRLMPMDSGVASFSLDTTISNTLDITLTPASAAGGNSWTALSGTLEKINAL